MKRFFSPTKGGAALQRRMQERQQFQNEVMANQAQMAPQPGAAPVAQGGEQQPSLLYTQLQQIAGRRQRRLGGKGATVRPRGNLMQPHATPLNQSAPGQFGAGVAENQQPNIM